MNQFPPVTLTFHETLQRRSAGRYVQSVHRAFFDIYCQSKDMAEFLILQGKLKPLTLTIYFMQKIQEFFKYINSKLGNFFLNTLNHFQMDYRIFIVQNDAGTVELMFQTRPMVTRTCEANEAGENSSFIFTVCVKIYSTLSF